MPISLGRFNKEIIFDHQDKPVISSASWVGPATLMPSYCMGCFIIVWCSHRSLAVEFVHGLNLCQSDIFFMEVCCLLAILCLQFSLLDRSIAVEHHKGCMLFGRTIPMISLGSILVATKVRNSGQGAKVWFYFLKGSPAS